MQKISTHPPPMKRVGGWGAEPTEHQRSDRIPAYRKTSFVGLPQGEFYSSLLHPSVSFVSPFGRQLTPTLPLEGSPPHTAACIVMVDPKDRYAHLRSHQYNTGLCSTPCSPLPYGQGFGPSLQSGQGVFIKPVVVRR